MERAGEVAVEEKRANLGRRCSVRPARVCSVPARGSTRRRMDPRFIFNFRRRFIFIRGASVDGIKLARFVRKAIAAGSSGARIESRQPRVGGPSVRWPCHSKYYANEVWAFCAARRSRAETLAMAEHWRTRGGKGQGKGKGWRYGDDEYERGR